MFQKLNLTGIQYNKEHIIYPYKDPTFVFVIIVFSSIYLVFFVNCINMLIQSSSCVFV